jgi:hypothetical protein
MVLAFSVHVLEAPFRHQNRMGNGAGGNQPEAAGNVE